MAFLVFSVSNFVLTLFASIITAFVAPAAAGSGIPEVKAYLNGVDAPGIFAFKTLIVNVRRHCLIFQSVDFISHYVLEFCNWFYSVCSHKLI